MLKAVANLFQSIASFLSAGTGISFSGSGTQDDPLVISATGGGDVTGPASSTDNAVARYDGATGKLIQNSIVTIDDNGVTVIPATAPASATQASLQVGTGTMAGSSLGTQIGTSAPVGFGGNVLDAQFAGNSTLVSNNANNIMTFYNWNAVTRTTAVGSSTGADNGVYTDITQAANAGSTALFASTASLQRVYMGFAQGLPGQVLYWNRVSGSRGISTLTIEYFSSAGGGTWVSTGITDNTTSFNSSGTISNSSYANGQQTTVNGVLAYWYRFTLNGNFSAVPNGKITYNSHSQPGRSMVGLLVAHRGCIAATSGFQSAGTLFGGVISTTNSMDILNVVNEDANSLYRIAADGAVTANSADTIFRTLTLNGGASNRLGTLTINGTLSGYSGNQNFAIGVNNPVSYAGSSFVVQNNGTKWLDWRSNGEMQLTGNIRVAQPANAALTGTIVVTGTNTLAGTGTAFLRQLSVGDEVQMSNAVGTFARVLTVSSDTAATTTAVLTNGSALTGTVRKPIYRGYDNSAVQKFMVDGLGKTVVAASTTGSASMNIPAGTAPTSPVEGDMWADSTQKAVAMYVDGMTQYGPGVIFTQTADQTVTNTVTETTILGTGVGTKTLPANFFAVGKTIRLRVGGVYSTPALATPSLIIKVKYGATVIATVTTTALLSGATNLEFDGEILITCRTTGASGTVMVHGDVEYATGVAGTISVDPLNNAGATTTIDTTASNALDVTVQWDTATSTRIAKSTVSAIEILN